MNNEIYRGYIGEMRGDDGDVWKEYVRVTEEVNGFAIWNPVDRDTDEREGLAYFGSNRDGMVEKAVALVFKLREQHKDSQFVRDDLEGEPA